MSLGSLSIRLAQSAIGIVVVLTLVFFVTHMLGDPVNIALPETAPQAQRDALREQLGLNRPVWIQYRDFLLDAARGSFGDSFWQKVPSLELVLGRLPATLYLAAAAAALILPLGIGVGVLAAFRPGSLLEHIANALSIASVSVVDFWLALMMILIFSVGLGILPTSGFGGIDHVLLPAVSLALLHAGSLAQVTRATVAEELSKGYVDAARARGVSETRVIVRHALRNALLPVITVGGSTIMNLMGGAIVAEVVFGWPGVGLLFIQAIEHRDLPLIEAGVFVTAVTVMAMNLLIDLLYVRLNPRVRVS